MKTKLMVLAVLSFVVSACTTSQAKPEREEERAAWRRERMMFHHAGRLGM